MFFDVIQVCTARLAAVVREHLCFLFEQHEEDYYMYIHIVHIYNTLQVEDFTSFGFFDGLLHFSCSTIARVIMSHFVPCIHLIDGVKYVCTYVGQSV